MIFAAEDWQVWTGFVGGGALTAVGAGVAWFLTWWSGRSDKFEDRKDARERVALEEWQGIVRRQDSNIANLDVKLRKSQEAQEECRQREMVLNRNLAVLHAFISRAIVVMRENKMAVEDLPPLEVFIPDGQPPPESTHDSSLVKQVLQASELVRAEAKHLGASSQEGPPQ